MNRRWRTGVWFALLLSLHACADLVPKDESSPYYPVPVGSKLILHSDLRIPPDSARAYLQYGKPVKAPHTTDPYCQFQVRDVLPVEQTIKADEFVVRKTQMDEKLISLLTPLIVAALPGFGMGDADDVTLVWYLWLDSPRQPNVLRLICGGMFDQPYRARRPSIKQIRQQLGDVATLVIAGEEKDRKP
jgi:hypothetical protein